MISYNRKDLLTVSFLTFLQKQFIILTLKQIKVDTYRS